MSAQFRGALTEMLTHKHRSAAESASRRGGEKTTIGTIAGDAVSGNRPCYLSLSAAGVDATEDLSTAAVHVRRADRQRSVTIVTAESVCDTAHSDLSPKTTPPNA